MDEEERMLTAEEVRSTLGISVPTYFRWLREGRLKGRRAGRRWRFPESAIRDLLRLGPDGHTRLQEELSKAIETYRRLLPAVPNSAKENDVKASATVKNKPGKTQAVRAKAGRGSGSGSNARTAGEVPVSAVGKPTVSELANLVLAHAVESRASVVHLDPSLDGATLRERVSGSLVPVGSPIPGAAGDALRRELKTRAGLDVDLESRPQSSRFQTEVAGKKVHIEAATYPTRSGESIALSLIDTGRSVPTLEQFEFPESLRTRLRECIHREHGVFLVNGPTGSGKTTTIYVLLRELIRGNLKIMTAESPLVYELEGVQQLEVTSEDGSGFVEAMRAMLRNDVDIALVSEVRDAESARMMFQMAATGHLVLSSLHANDAASAIGRLLDAGGVQKSLVAETLIGVLNQRLVRRNCPECRTLEVVRVQDANRLELRDDARAWTVGYCAGCAACSMSGYRGRRIVAELVTMTPALHTAIETGAPVDQMRFSAPRGEVSLRAQVLELVRDGTVSPIEAFRVLANQSA